MGFRKAMAHRGSTPTSAEGPGTEEIVLAESEEIIETIVQDADDVGNTPAEGTDDDDLIDETTEVGE